MRSLGIVFLLLGVGCSSAGGGGGPKDLATVSGTVWLQSAGEEAGDDVVIEAWRDADGNGRIDDAEKTSGSSDEAGHFSIQAPAGSGMTVLSFSRRGYARLLRTLALAPDSRVELEVVLFESPRFDCTAGVCIDDSGAASVRVAEAARARIRVFNPAVEAEAFPGEFKDSEGRMLISSVFASVELFDDDDNPIRQLPAGKLSRLEMRIPRDTWGSLRDLQPGDDRIQVPMYAFDEISGQWVREGTGWLVNSEGEVLVESDLPDIASGQFSSDLYVAAEVGHFSYWNVDWPEPENTSIQFQVVDEENQPIRDATCVVSGHNFTGNSPPLASGTGSECVDVWRSERSAEDLNENGVFGEERWASIWCRRKDKHYRFEPFLIPTQTAVCPQGGLTLPPLKLDSNSEVSPVICSVRGTVLLSGAPAENVMVTMEDPAIPAEMQQTMCGSNCRQGGVSDATGQFELSNAISANLVVSAYLLEQRPPLTLIFEGESRHRSCPTSPVTLHLSLKQCSAQLPQVTVTANGDIQWEPQVAAGAILVMSSREGTQKWMVTSDSGMTPPVHYGQVPAGAFQIAPASGTPPALASGDIVMVVPVGGYISMDGYRCSANGMTIIP